MTESRGKKLFLQTAVSIPQKAVFGNKALEKDAA